MTAIEPMRTIIPAAPGWYVATFVLSFDEQPDYLWLAPIIAWEIERERQLPDQLAWHNVVPLTIDGNMNSRGNPWGIKTPDGKYVYDGTIYDDDEAGVIADMSLEYEATLKRRAAVKECAP